MAILMIIIFILTIIAIIGWKNFLLFSFKYNIKYLNLANKLKKYSLLRILGISFCLIAIALFLSVRWGLGLENIIDDQLMNKNPSEYRSANLSIFFMLDLCSLLGILLPILAIFDWKHKLFLKPLSLLGLLGGGATILFTIPDLYGDHWFFNDLIYGSRTIGIGNNDEPLMFIMHWWMVVISVYVITKSRAFVLKDFIICIVFILTYAGYVVLVTRNLDIYSHATALVKGDFVFLEDSYYFTRPNSMHPEHLSYRVFCEIFNNYEWKQASAITWTTFFVIVCIFITIKNTYDYILVKKNILPKLQHQSLHNYKNEFNRKLFD